MNINDIILKVKSYFEIDIKISNGFSNKNKELLYSSLHTLLLSGLDLKVSMELVIAEFGNSKVAERMAKVLENLINGDMLSMSLRKEGVINDYEFYSLLIGEESGNLAYVLNELKEYYRNKINLNRQIISALTYPFLIIIVSFGAIIFMLNFVVPMFSKVFHQFGQDLPYITLMVISISEASSKYFYILPLIILSIVAVQIVYKDNIELRKFNSLLILKIPIFGELVKLVYISRFCMIMSLLVSSKVALLRAIELSSKMVTFFPIQQSLFIIKDEIYQGKLFYKSLDRFPIFDKKMVSLIRVGEETNKLDYVFNVLKTGYSEAINHRTKTLGALVEPIIIIFLGGIIAVILIAMYLPMFKLGGTLN